MIARTIQHSCHLPATPRISSLLTNHIHNLPVSDKRNSVVSVEVQQP
jgi:hypothetical protein